MKIAYLANVRIPSERAHSTQIIHMCQAFSENGLEVNLFGNLRTIGEKEDLDKYYGINSKFNFKRLNHGYFKPGIKITYLFSELFFSLNFLFSKPGSYDIIFSRNEWVIWILSFFIDKNKLVWESHEAKLNFPARRVLKKEVKTVVISEGIHDTYLEFGIKESQMLVAHDGIDESFFREIEAKISVRNRLGLNIDDKIVMYIGGFDKWKGVETFFQASDFTKNIQFVAIGGNEEQVSDFSKKYPKVKFLGSRPYSDLKHNQQAADVLVIPNTAGNDLSEKYTSPLKLFAHMASGVPIVVSNIISIRNIVEERYVTFVKPDKHEALAKGIRDTLLDLELRIEYAKELRALSRAYTWNSRAMNIIKFIK